MMGQTDHAGVPDLTDEDWQQRIELLYRYAQVGGSVNSVAHDLNNMLGAIMAYAELIGLDSPLEEEPRRMLEELLTAVKRSSKLVSNLTGIARKPRISLSPVNVNELIDRIVSIRNYDFASAGFALEVIPDDSIQEIVADRMSIELALMYLISNALDSLHANGGGSATIRAIAEDGTVQIELSDSHLPVAPEVAARMFEPYFTTREGIHVGLGLNCAQRIATMHGGDLTYNPTQGFILTLPFSGPPSDMLVDGS